MIGGARVRLNGWQQAAVAMGSAIGALMDPRRADLIAALGETTGKPAFERVLERMKKSPEGQAILLDRPRVVSARVGHAWDMPANTFGAAYAKFMGSRNFSPDDRPPVRFMETDELAYVAMRAREVHDFWHTLFSLPTNLIGESALKVIEFEQMFLPMCLLSRVNHHDHATEFLALTSFIPIVELNFYLISHCTNHFKSLQEIALCSLSLFLHLHCGLLRRIDSHCTNRERIKSRMDL
ncbi:unnamed protein product, partial [Vitis vinifera]